MRPAIEVAVDELRFLLTYDPGTGIFKHHPANKPARVAGKPAGWINKQGYAYLCINGRSFRAHRVAWAIYYGSWPKGQIDHINGDRSDNSITNLRMVNNADNAKNQCLRVNNTSGATGVTWSKQRNLWQAQIVRNGKLKSLGHYTDKNDAIAARKTAEQEMGFHKNHGRVVDGPRYANR